MDKKVKMWAWFDNENNEYRHIYKNREIVKICSPDGFKKATEQGKGRICEVYVSEVANGH